MKRIALLVIWLGLPLPGHTSGVDYSIHFQRTSVAEGLPQVTARAIAQDGQGFIWVGTQDGLARYDGYRFRVYRHDSADPLSLSDDFAQTIVPDDDGSLWVGTLNGGLDHYDPKSDGFQVFRHRHGQRFGLRNDSVSAIHLTPEAIWIGTEHGLHRLDRHSGRILAVPGVDANGNTIYHRITAILDGDADDSLLLGTAANGVLHLDIGKSVFSPWPNDHSSAASLTTVPVESLLRDHDGVVWIGTLGKGLYRYTVAHDLVHFSYSPQDSTTLGNDNVHALFEDAEDNVWVGTDDGLDRFTDGGFTHYVHDPTNPFSLGHGRIFAITADRAGMIWVGSWTGGVSRFYPMPQFRLLDNRVLQGRLARAIHAAPGGDIWVGTDMGLNRIDHADGSVQRIRHQATNDHSLTAGAIGLGAITMDTQGRLWAGTARGLNRSDDQGHSFVHFFAGKGRHALTSSNIYRLFASRNGAVWIGTAFGLNRWDPKTREFEHFVPASEQTGALVGSLVVSIAQDASDRLWVGTATGGLHWYNPTSHTFRRFAHDPADPNSLSHNAVTDIHPARNGVLWIATSSGLNKLLETHQGIRFSRFGREHGFASERLGKILEDSKGVLWISTIQGITRFDPATEKATNYGAMDNVIADGYWIGSGAHGADGRLYFGGVDGATVFNPRDIHKDRYAPGAVVTDFRIANRPVGVIHRDPSSPLQQSIGFTHRIHLPFTRNNFSLEFTSLNFRAPIMNQYAYRLTGLRDEWVYTDASRRVASYTNLDPGHYEFQVKAANKDGIWNDSPTRIDIEIMAPWWMTPWARGSAAVLLASLLLGLFRLRIRAVHQQKRRLEAEVNERTTALQTAKEKLELLGELGKEITAHLDMDGVRSAIHRRVSTLLELHTFGIALYDEQEAVIEFDFMIENGTRLPPRRISMEEENSLGVRCLRERKEIWVRDRQALSALVESPMLLTGDLLESVVYLPLTVHQRLIGCLTVQHREPNAFSTAQMDTLRSLATYAAIALDNAKTHRHLQDAQQQLVLQEKMVSLGMLTAGVAHEINNPTHFANLGAQNLESSLTRFKEFLRELSGGSHADAEVTQALAERFRELGGFLDIIKEGCARITGIVRDLKLFSRLDDADKNATDIAECLTATLRLVSTQYDDRIRFTTRFESVPLLECHPAQINQVFMNLLINACDAVEERMLTAVQGVQGEISLTLRFDGRDILVVIADNGTGMSDEVKSKLFEPFFTTKPAGKGTGMGMSIVYRIVQDHGGEIELQSKPGEGTTFTLRLPAHG